MTYKEKRLEKELFEMVYKWGKVGVVTDHECFAFKSTMQEIITQALAEERERVRGELAECIKYNNSLDVFECFNIDKLGYLLSSLEPLTGKK